MEYVGTAYIEPAYQQKQANVWAYASGSGYFRIVAVYFRSGAVTW